MAEQVIRRRVDDLERQRGNLDIAADEEIVFGIDGTSYVIDLSDRNAKDLRAALIEYVTAARPLIDVEARRDMTPAQAKRAELADVRAWANQQGMRVSTRGKVPTPVLDAFERSVGPLKHRQ
jgi:hypothetical protein